MSTKTTHNFDQTPRTTPLILVEIADWCTGTHLGYPLEFYKDGDDYLVVADTCVDHFPMWYKSITVNPEVMVLGDGQRFAAVAETLPEAERVMAWPYLVEVNPGFEENRQECGINPPVVRLKRVKQ